MDPVLTIQLIKATGVPLEVWKIICRMKKEDTRALIEKMTTLSLQGLANFGSSESPRILPARVVASRYIAQMVDEPTSEIAVLNQCDDTILSILRKRARYKRLLDRPPRGRRITNPGTQLTETVYRTMRRQHMENEERLAKIAQEIRDGYLKDLIASSGSR